MNFNDESFVACFNKMLTERFDIDSNILKCLKGKAIVAGSSCLQAELNVEWENTDLDVYTLCKDLPFVMAAFIMQGYEHIPSKDITVNEYEGAGFLSRNNIKGFVTLIKNSKEVQIMSVRHKTTLLDVVKRFDQSYCSIAYNFDGKAPIFCDTTREDVKQMKGILRKDYISMYYNCNEVLHGRIDKYEKRGMKLDIPVSFYDHKKVWIDRKRIWKNARKQYSLTGIWTIPPPPSSLPPPINREDIEKEIVQNEKNWHDKIEEKIRLRSALILSGMEMNGYDSNDEEDIKRVFTKGNPKAKEKYDENKNITRNQNIVLPRSPLTFGYLPPLTPR